MALKSKVDKQPPVTQPEPTQPEPAANMQVATIPEAAPETGVDTVFDFQSQVALIRDAVLSIPKDQLREDVVESLRIGVLTGEFTNYFAECIAIITQGVDEIRTITEPERFQEAKEKMKQMEEFVNGVRKECKMVKQKIDAYKKTNLLNYEEALETLWEEVAGGDVKRGGKHGIVKDLEIKYAQKEEEKKQKYIQQEQKNNERKAKVSTTIQKILMGIKNSLNLKEYKYYDSPHIKRDIQIISISQVYDKAICLEIGEIPEYLKRVWNEITALWFDVEISISDINKIIDDWESFEPKSAPLDEMEVLCNPMKFWMALSKAKFYVYRNAYRTVPLMTTIQKFEKDFSTFDELSKKEILDAVEKGIGDHLAEISFGREWDKLKLEISYWSNLEAEIGLKKTNAEAAEKKKLERAAAEIRDKELRDQANANAIALAKIQAETKAQMDTAAAATNIVQETKIVTVYILDVPDSVDPTSTQFYILEAEINRLYRLALTNEITTSCRADRWKQFSIENKIKVIEDFKKKFGDSFPESTIKFKTIQK